MHQRRTRLIDRYLKRRSASHCAGLTQVAKGFRDGSSIRFRSLGEPDCRQFEFDFAAIQVTRSLARPRLPDRRSPSRAASNVRSRPAGAKDLGNRRCQIFCIRGAIHRSEESISEDSTKTTEYHLPSTAYRCRDVFCDQWLLHYRFRRVGPAIGS